MSLYCNQQPTVLIFDSGVGGISVYNEIKKRLPTYNYIYLFDNKAYPYGELDQLTLLERVHRLILAALDKHHIDLVVIACNTASTIVLPTLRLQVNVPIVGVVPAIKPASMVSEKAVGLIATPATIKRKYTHQLIKEFSQNKPVELIGSTELVDMAERKLRSYPVEIDKLETILLPLKTSVDIVVLGCTHFPLIKEEIGQVLGTGIRIIDSGEAIARRVDELLPTRKSVSVKPKKSKIYSSATPFESAALDITLSKIGFDSIEMFPSLDA